MYHLGFLTPTLWEVPVAYLLLSHLISCPIWIYNVFIALNYTEYINIQILA